LVFLLALPRRRGGLLTIMSTLIAFQATCLFVFNALAIDEPLRFDWKSEIYSRAGTPIGCSIGLTAMTQSFVFITVDFSYLIEEKSRDKFLEMTLLKVTTKQLNRDNPRQTTPIKIYSAWIRSSTGTTAGHLNSNESEPYYVGGVAGGDLFTVVIKGIFKDGLVLGYQTKAAGLDTMLRFSAPPSPKVIEEFLLCFGDMEKHFEPASGQ